MSLIVNNIDKNWWYEGVPIRARTRRAKPGTAKAAATSCLSRTLDIGVLVYAYYQIVAPISQSGMQCLIKKLNLKLVNRGEVEI
jgi:hypothetical protein